MTSLNSTRKLYTATQTAKHLYTDLAFCQFLIQEILSGLDYFSHFSVGRIYIVVQLEMFLQMTIG